MYAQGIEVLHVAHGDTVIIAVAHHLILYLLPPLQALLHQHLWREGEGLLRQAVQLLLVVAEATAKSSQRVGGTQYDGIAQLTGCLTGRGDIVASLTLDGLDIYLIKPAHKQLAVLRVHDSLNGGAKHPDTIPLKHTAPVKLHTAVERRLTTKGQQDAVRTLLLDNPLHEIRLHRQEVNLVGHSLRGLHRCDVRVDQHCPDTLFLQGFQGLAAAVVELAGLAYLERAAAQQQHLLYRTVSHNVSINRSNINSVSTGPEQASG